MWMYQRFFLKGKHIESDGVVRSSWSKNSMLGLATVLPVPGFLLTSWVWGRGGG